MTYICPVCSYDQLDAPPANFEICPSCGTEFGYDDANTSHAELRRRWLSMGAPWFDDRTPQPANWDLVRQVVRADMPPVELDYEYKIGRLSTLKIAIDDTAFSFKGRWTSRFAGTFRDSYGLSPA